MIEHSSKEKHNKKEIILFFLWYIKWFVISVNNCVLNINYIIILKRHLAEKFWITDQDDIKITAQMSVLAVESLLTLPSPSLSLFHYLSSVSCVTVTYTFWAMSILQIFILLFSRINTLSFYPSVPTVYDSSLSVPGNSNIHIGGVQSLQFCRPHMLTSWCAKYIWRGVAKCNILLFCRPMNLQSFGASRESKTRVNWQNRSEAKDGAIKVREMDGHMVDVSRCKCSL